jgi:hypothetical protein
VKHAIRLGVFLLTLGLLALAWTSPAAAEPQIDAPYSGVNVRIDPVDRQDYTGATRLL